MPLEDLAILHPSAGECQTKEEFLAEDVERLRQLSVLAVKQCPAEVDRLTEEFPQVGVLLRLPSTHD